VPYVRTVKTKSGATAVQVVWSSRRGSREIEHIGSAHDEAELDALRAAAGQRIAAGQPELDLGLEAGPSGPLPITSSRMGHLLDALERGYRVLGLDGAAGGDEVFRQLVLARIIEPASKIDSLRVTRRPGRTRIAGWLPLIPLSDPSSGNMPSAFAVAHRWARSRRGSRRAAISWTHTTSGDQAPSAVTVRSQRAVDPPGSRPPSSMFALTIRSGCAVSLVTWCHLRPGQLAFVCAWGAAPHGVG
jgi:hypothetical protein